MPEDGLRPAVVAAYALVALLALRAGHRGIGRERTVWLITAGTLLLLGAAKWLRMQEAMTEVGRNLIRSGGWYAEHREVQAVAAFLIAGISVAAAFLLWRCLRGVPPKLAIACATLGLLLTFIAVRAASIHDVDQWVTASYAGMRQGWWVELAALLVIAVTALAYSARRVVRR